MSPLTLVLVLLSLVSLSAAQSLTFSTVTQTPSFPPREYPACAQTNPAVGTVPTLYFFGGFSVTGSGSYTDNYLNDAWASTNFGQSWSQLNSTAAYPPQAWNGAVSTPNGLIYIGGGGDVNANQNNQVWISTNGALWTLSTANPGFDPRENAGIANIPNTATIIVALGNTRNDVFVDDIWLSTDGYGAQWTQQCSGASGGNQCPLIVQSGNETGQLHGPTLVGLYSGSWVLMGGYGSFANGTTSFVSNQVAYSSNNFASYSTYSAPWSPRAQQRAVVDTDNYVYVYGGVYDLPTGTSPSQIYYNYFTDVWYSTNAASSSASWTSLGSFATSLGSAGYSGVPFANNPNPGIASTLYTNGVVFNPCFAFGWSGSQKQLILYTGVYSGFRQVNPQAAPAWPGVYVGTLNIVSPPRNGASSVAAPVLSVAVAVMAAVALLF